ncbi:MAG: protein kinase [Myxococcales bacterium]
MRRFLHEHGKVSPERATMIIREACEGASVAHAQGIVHRDLKPENLFLARQGERTRVKLLDFGIAKLRDHATEQGNGKILGTPAYMPPEQARGEPTDERADVYALGVIFFELLTGELPHPGESQHEILSHVLFKAPRSVRELEPSLPAALAQVTQKAIASQVTERFQSVKEFLQALSRFEAAGPTDVLSPAQQPGSMEERTLASLPTVPARDSEIVPRQEPASATSEQSRPVGSRRARTLALLASAALLAVVVAARWRTAEPGPTRAGSRGATEERALAQKAAPQAALDVRPSDAPAAIPEARPDAGQVSSAHVVSNRPLEQARTGGALPRPAAPGHRRARAAVPTVSSRVSTPSVASAPQPSAGETRDPTRAQHIEIKQGPQTLLFKRENPLREGSP